MRDEGRSWSLETNSHVLLLIETILIKIKEGMKLFVQVGSQINILKIIKRLNLLN